MKNGVDIIMKKNKIKMFKLVETTKKLRKNKFHRKLLRLPSTEKMQLTFFRHIIKYVIYFAIVEEEFPGRNNSLV